MVGAEGFEPPALCSQSRCATRLRYAPTNTSRLYRETDSTRARTPELVVQVEECFPQGAKNLQENL